MESNEGFLARLSVYVRENLFLIVNKKIAWLIDRLVNGWHEFLV